MATEVWQLYFVCTLEFSHFTTVQPQNRDNNLYQKENNNSF